MFNFECTFYSRPATFSSICYQQMVATPSFQIKILSRRRTDAHRQQSHSENGIKFYIPFTRKKNILCLFQKVKKKILHIFFFSLTFFSFNQISLRIKKKEANKKINKISLKRKGETKKRDKTRKKKENNPMNKYANKHSQIAFFQLN